MSCGLSLNVLRWFKSYFTRTQSVKFNDQLSDILIVDTGIGQGTVLGPLVFVFYINDVVKNIADLRINMYADDCLIYTVGNNWDIMYPKIQNSLNGFQNWCLSNSLKLNAGKTKALVLGSPFKTSMVNQANTFFLDNEPVTFANVYNYLGIMLDKHMTLSFMLTKVKNVISRKIYELVNIRDLITIQCALTIYKQTILPLFDYSGFVMISCNVSNRNDLQTLQNNALRVCFNVKLRDRVSVNRMHDRANLLSLEQRRQIQLLCLMFIFKERHDNVRRVHNRRTRAAEIYSFVRERYNCIKYKNSPYYKGSILWDSLPVITRNSMSLLVFKNLLKNSYNLYCDKLS